MSVKRLRLQLPILALSAGALLHVCGCSTSQGHWSVHADNPVLLETGRLTEGYEKVINPAQPPPKLLIDLVGFFNNEHPGHILPKPITYGYVDLPAVHEGLVAYARKLPWTQGTHVLSTSETQALLRTKQAREAHSPSNEQMFLDLVGLYFFVEGSAIPAHAENNVRLPLQLGPNWTASDRVLFILGLETPPPSPKAGLAAVLGCYWFTGQGDYLGMSVEPYDFGHFRSEQLNELGRHCFPA